MGPTSTPLLRKYLLLLFSPSSNRKEDGVRDHRLKWNMNAIRDNRDQAMFAWRHVL